MNGDLPRGWAWASLQNLCEVTLGQSPPSSSYNNHGSGEPFFQGKAEFGDRFPAVKKWTTEPKKRATAGSVLISVRAPVGPTNIASMDCAIGRGLASLRPLDGISTDFLLWAMRNSARELARNAAGSTFDAITGRQLRSHRIPVAPLAEQERIVAVIEEHFSRLDAVDTALKATRTKMHALQRSAAATVFDQPDWIWTTLGEIAVLKGGITKDSKRETDPDFVEYPYLRVANVQRGFLDLSEVTTIRADPHKATKLVLQPGDVLFNEGGDRDKLGRGWVWEGQIENCIHQNHVFRARLTDDRFDPYFISMHANTWGQHWFDTHGKQTTNLASISLTTLKSFPVPAPPPHEQRAAVDELQSIMRSEDRLRADLDRVERRSKTLRRAVLSRAFSGELVPQDPNDESASVLLAHIAPSRRAC